jgi:hypothetical protein
MLKLSPDVLREEIGVFVALGLADPQIARHSLRSAEISRDLKN